MLIFLRWIAALLLLIGAIWQGEILFKEWQQIPRQDFAAWRIEYASINLEDKNQTELKIQTRVDKTSLFKNIALPNLEVILTDTADEVIASRVLKPQEWLPQEVLRDNNALLLGIAPESEITTTVPMQIPENASGYRIRVFYP
jgi:ribosomal protein L11 methyltransferase